MDAHDDLSRPGCCKLPKPKQWIWFPLRPKRQNLHRNYKRMKVLKNTKEYRKLCFVDSDRRLTYDPGCGKESVDRSIARSPHKHKQTASSLQAESGQLFSFFFFPLYASGCFSCVFWRLPGGTFLCEAVWATLWWFIPGVSYPAGHSPCHHRLMIVCILILILFWLGFVGGEGEKMREHH
jgi:hypothetical protein